MIQDPSSPVDRLLSSSSPWEPARAHVARQTHQGAPLTPCSCGGNTAVYTPAFVSERTAGGGTTQPAPRLHVGRIDTGKLLRAHHWDCHQPDSTIELYRLAVSTTYFSSTCQHNRGTPC